MKMFFIHSTTANAVVLSPKRRKIDEPYHCPSLLPGEHFQAKRRGSGLPEKAEWRIWGCQGN